jgi:hypothetical protein
VKDAPPFDLSALTDSELAFLRRTGLKGQGGGEGVKRSAETPRADRCGPLNHGIATASDGFRGDVWTYVGM